MNVRIDPATGGRTLKIEGELRLPAIEELREALLEALAAGGSTVIHLEAATSIDLCGLQLLASALRTFQNQRQDCSIQGQTEPLRNSARLAGFTCLDAPGRNSWQKQS